MSTVYCCWIFQLQSTEQSERVVMTTRLLLNALVKGHGVNVSQQNSTQCSYSLHCCAKCDVPRLNTTLMTALACVSQLCLLSYV